MSEDFNNIFIGKLEDEEEKQDLKSNTSESEIMNGLEFSLEVKCTKDPVTPGQFVDSHVLTDKLIWVPRGDQATWLTDPGPQQKDILINKLRPGHEMEIKLFAVKVDSTSSI